MSRLTMTNSLKMLTPWEMRRLNLKPTLTKHNLTDDLKLENSFNVGHKHQQNVIGHVGTQITFIHRSSMNNSFYLRWLLRNLLATLHLKHGWMQKFSGFSSCSVLDWDSKKIDSAILALLECTNDNSATLAQLLEAANASLQPAPLQRTVFCS